MYIPIAITNSTSSLISCLSAFDFPITCLLSSTSIILELLRKSLLQPVEDRDSDQEQDKGAEEYYAYRTEIRDLVIHKDIPVAIHDVGHRIELYHGTDSGALRKYRFLVDDRGSIHRHHQDEIHDVLGVLDVGVDSSEDSAKCQTEESLSHSYKRHENQVPRDSHSEYQAEKYYDHTRYEKIDES